MAFDLVTKKKLKEEFLRLFEQNNGLVYRTCKQIGLTIPLFYKWRSEDPEWNSKINLIQMSLVDQVADKLFEMAMKGNMVAIIFYLVNRSKGEWVNIQRVESHIEMEREKINKTLDTIAKSLRSHNNKEEEKVEELN